MRASGLNAGQLSLDDVGVRAGGKRTLSPVLFRRVFTLAEMVADFVATTTAVYFAYALYFWLHIGRHVEYAKFNVFLVGSIAGLLTTLLLERDGAYKGGNSLLRIRETERAIRITAQTFLIFLPVAFLLQSKLSRGALILALLLVPLVLVVEKEVLFSVGRSLHALGHGVERVAIYGAGYTGRRVLTALLHSTKLGFEPVVMLDEDPLTEGSRVFELGYRRTQSLKVRSGPITPEALAATGCDSLVVAIPSLPSTKFFQVAEAAKQAKMRVAFLPGQSINELYWTDSIDVDGLLLASLSGPGTRWHYKIAKRTFDVVSSLTLIVLLAPLLITVAILVLLDSPGPVLFVQTRIGKYGRPFEMYKFRSMRTEAPRYGFSPTSSRDPRITRIGALLRKFSLDEVPQLLNVLKGEMSLVGPRPEMPFIVDSYDARQRQRLNVTPGITGLWQLSADRAFQIHENIQYDVYYIQHRSFFLDIAVLIHTFFFAMRGI